MNLSQLKYFSAVAASGHLTHASEDLNVSQSTVSMALQQLEDELGVQLFEKAGRRKRLTQAGMLFQRHVRNIFDELERANTEFSELGVSRHGTIRLAADLTDALMPGEIEFLKRNPHISLLQTFTTTGSVRKQLLSRDIDFGITHVSLSDNDITSTPFLSERVGLLTSSRHPLAGRKQVSLKELESYDFITMAREHSYRHMADEFCRSADFQPHIRAEALHTHMLHTMVAANLGIAFISDGFWVRNIMPPLSDDTIRNDLRPSTFDLRGQYSLIPIADEVCRRSFYISHLKNRDFPIDIWYFYIFLCQYYEAVEQEQIEFRQKIGWN